LETRLLGVVVTENAIDELAARGIGSGVMGVAAAGCSIVRRQGGNVFVSRKGESGTLRGRDCGLPFEKALYGQYPYRFLFV